MAAARNLFRQDGPPQRQHREGVRRNAFFERRVVHAEPPVPSGDD